jgi:hypothetical protein
MAFQLNLGAHLALARCISGGRQTAVPARELALHMAEPAEGAGDCAQERSGDAEFELRLEAGDAWKMPCLSWSGRATHHAPWSQAAVRFGIRAVAPRAGSMAGTSAMGTE